MSTEAASPERTEVRHIMGMPIGIDLRHPGKIDLDLAFDWLRRVDATFSTYRPDSDLSRLDRGEISLRECSPDVDDVLAQCVPLYRRTNGYFSVRPSGRLDPSGFVKGWAVSQAADRLARAGAENFCINAGGDIVVRGRPAPDRLWKIGIRHPKDLEQLAAVLEIEDLAVATSAAYEQGNHIINPHTGQPPTGLLSATIAGPDLALADAYATAAYAMGEAGPAWAATLPGYESMCITHDHRVLTSTGFDTYRVS